MVNALSDDPVKGTVKDLATATIEEALPSKYKIFSEGIIDVLQRISYWINGEE